MITKHAQFLLNLELKILLLGGLNFCNYFDSLRITILRDNLRSFIFTLGLKNTS